MRGRVVMASGSCQRRAQVYSRDGDDGERDESQATCRSVMRMNPGSGDPKSARYEEHRDADTKLGYDVAPEPD